MDMVKELFLRGGPIMWPLLICSLISVTITIERVMFWRREGEKHKLGLVDRLFSCVDKGEYDEAINVSGPDADACTRVLASGLQHREHGLSEAMKIAAGDEMESMKQGMAVLDTIITMAPLLGILGTVLGIIESFDLLGAMGIEDPKAVTGGIAQALITTAAGLTVALISLIPFNWLIAKIQRETKRLEHIATQMEVTYRRSRKNMKATA